MSSALFPQVTISSITNALAPNLAEILNTVTLPGTSDLQSRVAAFLDRLFYRAPPEVSRKKGAEELRQIATGCLEALYQQRTDPDRVSVNFKQSDLGTGVFIALTDHPFIISSLAERFYEAGIPLNCFQHPILATQSGKIALSYIEIAPNFRGNLDAFIPELRDTLCSLVTVVDEHELMLSMTKGASTKFELASTPSDQLVPTEWGSLPSGELRSFIEWLTEDSFFFIGVSAWSSDKTITNGSGIWNRDSSFSKSLKREIGNDIDRAHGSKISFIITKLQLRSPVHRKVPLLHVLFKSNNSGWISLIGFLTSKALACEAFDIPILRAKLHQILATEQTPPNSHDYKYVIEVIDNMPTDEALRLPVRDLQTISQLALGVFSREDSRSVTCIDTQHRWALTTIVIPPERYGAALRDDTRSLIESWFKVRSGSSEFNLDSTKRRQLRLYISTPLGQAAPAPSELEDLGRALQRATLNWRELLEEKIHFDSSFNDKPQISFPESYQAGVSTSEALHDYRLAAALNTNAPLAISLFHETSTNREPQISFISLKSSTNNGAISLSTAVPVLENIGLEVLDANSYLLTREEDEIHLLKCAVRPFDKQPLDLGQFNATVAPGLVAILQGKALSDPLNLLLRTKGLSIEEISLLRCYCALLWQTYKIATKRTMWKALAYSPEVAATFVRYFDTAFNPTLKLTLDQRKAQCIAIEQAYQIALRSVRDITHDRILKALLVLIKHTVRTNFYLHAETITLKIHSERVEFMPHPRPLYEIFVYSSRIEGTHLRSSKVARGGIRWSERLDDYRSEVLGLVKTQKVKNVIIVPSGAKGGFIVKSAAAPGESMSSLVESSYREYIRAMLSITDNIVNGEPVHPSDCVIYDDLDPYFVVAADKGTATFSDTANSIAQDNYSFWLGDAFASGGSQGYDHKKYGITARGGWECVKRHARDLGINTSEPFTTVGIGDMSGDVFGNAMILTSNMLLIGAFNHKHIFIDPTPNQEAAFKERCRLFALPRSQWSDFDRGAISEGGGVFERFAKEIQLSPQIRSALGLADDVPGSVDGETLISFILKAPVTLLWNGGIGTYVKARTESHSDVNDGANDAVRVNADELRCSIIGEGGNVGFTQKARIQCAQSGIRLNTDAIDNSGGVDLSDHEVNLKLLFAPLVKRGKLSYEARNDLLKDIAPDVVESVLQHNRDQSLLLTVAEQSSTHTIEQYRALIREMHSLGFLDRVRDYLPDEQEIDMRAASQRGLYRPELAICSAAVKMWLKDGLRTADLLNDPHLEGHLLAYFPPRVRSEYQSEVLTHSLRREIIANEIVGQVTLSLGIEFLPAVVSSTGASIPQALRSILAADAILDAQGLRERLHDLDTVTGCRSFIESWTDLSKSLQYASAWLMQTHPESSMQELIELYAASFASLIPHANTMFSSEELARFEGRIAKYREKGLSESDARNLSLLRRIHVALETLWCAREYKQDVRDVATTLAVVLNDLQLQPLFKFGQALQSGNRWEQELADGSFQEIRRELSRITGKLLLRPDRGSAEGIATLARYKPHQTIRAIMSEVNDGMRTKRPFSISVLPLIARNLRELGGLLGGG
jgi:glutamate dehydrogenase